MVDFITNISERCYKLFVEELKDFDKEMFNFVKMLVC